LLLLTGCAVGPDFVTPPPPDVTGYTPEPLGGTTASANAPAGEAQRFDRGRDLPGEWWTLFHSRALNALVEKRSPPIPICRLLLKDYGIFSRRPFAMAGVGSDLFTRRHHG
jgi:hypothetical protein